MDKFKNKIIKIKMIDTEVLGVSLLLTYCTYKYIDIPICVSFIMFGIFFEFTTNIFVKYQKRKYIEYRRKSMYGYIIHEKKSELTYEDFMFFSAIFVFSQFNIFNQICIMIFLMYKLYIKYNYVKNINEGGYIRNMHVYNTIFNISFMLYLQNRLHTYMCKIDIIQITFIWLGIFIYQFMLYNTYFVAEAIPIESEDEFEL